MLSSSKRNALAEVVIPCPFNQFLVAACNLHEVFERGYVETDAVGDAHLRVQPKLRFAGSGAHVHVHRFAGVAFVRIEEEAKALVSEHHRHALSLRRRVVAWYETNRLRGLRM